MGFNELNKIEHYIIHKLSGVNLNDSTVQESDASYGQNGFINQLRNSIEVSMKFGRVRAKGSTCSFKSRNNCQTRTGR